MISNGKDKPITAGTVPTVGGFLLDWFQPMTFTRVTKTVLNGELVETTVSVSAQAVRQPMSAQTIQRKPEGQRGWKWQTLHALPDLVLLLDDKVVFNGEPYRVQARLDWSEYGYVEYHICEDFR